MLRNVLNRILRFNWTFGVMLILLLGIPRFIVVLNAQVTGKFHYISIVFLVMWLLPFIFLTKKGRQSIGIKKAKNPAWIPYAFLLGAAISLGVYLIGFVLYEQSYDNWFVYIARPFELAPNINESEKMIIFIVSAIISMTFSPIGEELLYRGLIHSSFQVDVGDNRASYIDSAAFALTHLAHFGIVFLNDQWSFRWVPALLWVVLMFFTSRLFFLCKERSGTLLGAIICHAAFNLVMMYIIFFQIL